MDEVVVQVYEGQFGPVVVVYRGGQIVMLATRYNRSNLLEAAKKTLRCSGTTPMVLTCRK